MQCGNGIAVILDMSPIHQDYHVSHEDNNSVGRLFKHGSGFRALETFPKNTGEGWGNSR